jgi:hypothetical protein
MYSSRVSDLMLRQLEKSNKTKFIRYPVAKCEEWAAHIDSLVEDVDAKTGQIRKWKRSLKAEEKAFIKNELMVCKVDFPYFCNRYVTIIKDQGKGRGRLEFWASQLKLLGVMGKLEEENWDRLQRGETVDGIRVALNKSRQLGATTVSRALMMHRLTLWNSHRGLSASVDEDKVDALYLQDKRILDNLPKWMHPSIGYDVKDSHLFFDALDCTMLYQHSQQKTGLGQGRQFELGHITECASFQDPLMIEHDFFPTLPQSFQTLCILESTPQGRQGWWPEFTKDVRENARVGWTYVFVPWYIEEQKYRRTPPEGWQPSKLSLLHAQKVYETSEGLIGRKVMLEKDHLYWYETSRYAAQKAGQLASFLTNYCATTEESFQHLQQSAIPTEILEELRLKTQNPGIYEMANA